MLKRFVEWLKGFLPMKVWLTRGPAGGGPWFDNPNDAAEFLRDEWEADDWLEDQTKGTMPEFMQPGVLATLVRRPGEDVKENGWGVECISVTRRAFETAHEWDGW